MELFGLFKDIYNTKIKELKYVNFYENVMAKVYDKMISSNYDIELYCRQAALLNGEILELACGSGRVTLHLVKNGYKVTGIDLSKDMISHLEDNIKLLPRRLRDNVQIFLMDMLNINMINKSFNIVILPATTICLIDDISIINLFEQVYMKLVEGGRFIFDFCDYKNIMLDCEISDINGFIFEEQMQDKNIVFYQEKLDYCNNKSVVNFYLDSINIHGISKKYLSSTVKYIRSEEKIRDFIRQTKFRIVRFSKYDPELPDNTESMSIIKYVILEK